MAALTNWHRASEHPPIDSLATPSRWLGLLACAAMGCATAAPVVVPGEPMPRAALAVGGPPVSVAVPGADGRRAGSCDASCATEGRCVPTPAGCAAGSSADCAASRACREGGRCQLVADACVAATAESCAPLCTAWGHCSVREGRCVRASSADCKRSELCSSAGRCDLVDGECVATDDAACAASEGCRASGACTRAAGVCTVGSSDCRRHALCRELGRCERAPRSLDVSPFFDARCVARSDDDCRRSQGCRDDGACAAAWESCHAASAADCARSSGCKTNGACRFSGGGCMP